MVGWNSNEDEPNGIEMSVAGTRRVLELGLQERRGHCQGCVVVLFAHISKLRTASMAHVSVEDKEVDVSEVIKARITQ